MQFFHSLTCLVALVATAASAAYTGPCSASACGASSAQCPKEELCVPFPTFDPALREGCTCSEALKKRTEGSFMKRRGSFN